MVLGSIQPMTEMSTSNIFLGGKGDRCVGSLNLLEVSGPIQACIVIVYISTIL